MYSAFLVSLSKSICYTKKTRFTADFRFKLQHKNERLTGPRDFSVKIFYNTHRLLQREYDDMRANEILQNSLLLVGRICLALVFVVAGWGKLTSFSATAASLVAMGVPASEFALALIILVELGGGIFLIMGFYSRFFACLMLLFTVVATFTYHNFWFMGGTAAKLHMTQFLKNAGLIGGMLYVMVNGPGKFSIRG